MNLKLQNILYKLSNRNNGDVDTNFTRFCQFVSPSCCFIELQSFLESKTNRQFWGKNLSNFLGEQICVVNNGLKRIMKSEPSFLHTLTFLLNKRTFLFIILRINSSLKFCQSCPFIQAYSFIREVRVKYIFKR